MKAQNIDHAIRGIGAAAILLMAVGLSLLMPMTSPTQASDPPPPSVSLIEEAYQKGRIGYETSLLYRVYSIFDPQRLPAEYQSSTPAKCATPILKEVNRNWGTLTSQARSELAAYGLLSRPSLSGPELIHDTAHFQIHYTTSGQDAADPSYIEAMGAELENVWATELKAMGWLPPPSDQAADGDPDYDVYVQELPLWYGYTMGDGEADQGVQPGDNENSPGVVEFNAWHSYMVLEDDYYGFPCTPLDCMRVTAAHEFNHAIQFGYDAWEEDWLMESTATWMEDEVYDHVNDNLGYLVYYFDDPDLCLPATTPLYPNRWYADWILIRFISEHHGGQSTIRNVWEHSVNYKSSLYDRFAFNALGDALTAIGTSLPSVFTRFAAANYVMSTCPTNVPYCYKEAWFYPDILVEGSVDFNGEAIHYQTRDGVEQYGADYIEIDPSVNSMAISVVGTTAATTYAAQLVALQGGIATVIPIPMSGSPSSGSVQLEVSNYDSLTLIVMNVTPTTGVCTYSNYFVILDTGTTPDLNCGAAVATGCGDKHQGDTTGAPSNIAYYNCIRPWKESGPEDVYVLTTETTGDIIATLDDISADLDVFILSSCSAMSCLAYGDNAAKYRHAPPGTYYIVVDGYKGASGSYTLSVKCANSLDCSAAVSASCGGSYQGNTTGENSNVTYYNCSSWDESGPEEIYVLTTEASGDISAALSGTDVEADLDVFMLSSCDENTTLAYDDDTASYSHAPPGTYYIVVEGYKRDAGSYTLDISCSTCPGLGTAYIAAEDNENNGRTGCPDGDMYADSDCVFKADPQHPIEFNIPVASLPSFEMAQLSIRAWDVDEGGDPADPPECVERDEVYLNGQFVGHLTGADKTWSTSVFDVDPGLIQQGNNLVEVQIDVGSCGACAGVDWGQLTLDGGGGATSIESVVLDKACYLPGSTANVMTTLHTMLTSQEVRIEVKVLDAENSYLIGTSETMTIYGPGQKNDVSWPLALPMAAAPGDYTLQLIVFDTCSETQNDYRESTFRIDPVCATPTPTPTSTATPTSTPTGTPTLTPTDTPTPTQTPTGTITPPTHTFTPTNTPTPFQIYLPTILKTLDF